MTPEQRIEDNNSTFWRLRPTIDRTYPKGWAVAIDDGRIIADAGTFEQLDAILAAQGADSREVLVAEAGFEYPRPDDYTGIWITPLEDEPAATSPTANQEAGDAPDTTTDRE
jgi:hypothetical protein